MYKRIFTVVLLATPTFVLAADTGALSGTPLGETLNRVGALINFFLSIAMPLAIAYFFWGLIQFIKAGDSADLKGKGKDRMIASGVALFLMVGIWTILGYVQKSAGIHGQVEVSSPPSLDVVPQGRFVQ